MAPRQRSGKKNTSAKGGQTTSENRFRTSPIKAQYLCNVNPGERVPVGDI